VPIPDGNSWQTKQNAAYFFTEYSTCGYVLNHADEKCHYLDG
jgi:hypothetical protein